MTHVPIIENEESHRAVTAEDLERLREDYDLRDEFKERLLPLVEEISDVCLELELPFQAHFSVLKDGDGTEFASLAGAYGPRTPHQILACIAIGEIDDSPLAQLASETLARLYLERVQGNDTT